MVININWSSGQFLETAITVFDPTCGSGQFLERAIKATNRLEERLLKAEKIRASQELLEMSNRHLQEVETPLITTRILPSTQLMSIENYQPNNFFDKPSSGKIFVFCHPPYHRWTYFIKDTLDRWSDNTIASFVLPNCALNSKIREQYNMRKLLIDSDYLDCIIALPNLSTSSPMNPGCILILTQSKNNSNRILFINADRQPQDTANQLIDQDWYSLIPNTYKAWKNLTKKQEYQDIWGFCKSVKKEEIKNKDYVFISKKYVDWDSTCRIEENNSIERATFPNSFDSITEVYVLKREKIENINDFSNPAVYILVGKHEGLNPNSQESIYIGKTENIRRRIKEHNKYKIFWTRVAILTSKNSDHPLNQSQCSYLERKLLQLAKQANVASIFNDNIPNHPHLSKSDTLTADNFLAESIKLLDQLGLTMFKI